MPIEINELIGDPGDSDSSSDSDQDISDFRPPSNLKPKINIKERDKIINSINKKIARGEKVDLSQYPPLYVVHYRGIHFFKPFFTQEQRKIIRQEIKKDEQPASLYALGVHELAGVPSNSVMDAAQRKEMSKKSIDLKNKFIELESTVPTDNWFGKKQHLSEQYRHYQRYVNNYSEFRNESEQKIYSTYKILPTTKNPYISTADSPRHALFYALGAKAEGIHGALRPTYLHDDNIDEDIGRAKHPKVGYIQVFFHTLDSLARNRPLYLSPLHAANKIDIDSRLLNERETTFKAKISKRHIVHTEIVRYPSFNKPYVERYHLAKYGLTSNMSKKMLKSIKGESNSLKTTLIDKLVDHYNRKLLETVEKIALNKGGFVVYLGLDGTLKSALPTTVDISAERGKKHGNLMGLFDKNMSLYYQPTLDAFSDSEDEESDIEKKVSSLSESFKKLTLSEEEIDSIRGTLVYLMREGEYRNFEEKLIHAMRKGLDVNQVGRNSGRTLLQSAIVKDKVKFAQILIENGAKINVLSISNKTAHHYAEEYKRGWWNELSEAPDFLEPEEIAEYCVQADLPGFSNIIGDGNCFFRSVLEALGDNQENHQILRENAVQFIRDNPSKFPEGTFVITLNNQEIQVSLFDYLVYMSVPGNYAEGAIIEAVALCLNCQIEIVQLQKHQNKIIAGVPFVIAAVEHAIKNILLLRVNNNHYHAILRPRQITHMGLFSCMREKYKWDDLDVPDSRIVKKGRKEYYNLQKHAGQYAASAMYRDAAKSFNQAAILRAELIRTLPNLEDYRHAEGIALCKQCANYYQALYEWQCGPNKHDFSKVPSPKNFGIKKEIIEKIESEGQTQLQQFFLSKRPMGRV